MRSFWSLGKMTLFLPGNHTKTQIILIIKVVVFKLLELPPGLEHKAAESYY